jgi:hypothetical protein
MAVDLVQMYPGYGYMDLFLIHFGFGCLLFSSLLWIWLKISSWFIGDLVSYTVHLLWLWIFSKFSLAMAVGLFPSYPFNVCGSLSNLPWIWLSTFFQFTWRSLSKLPWIERHISFQFTLDLFTVGCGPLSNFHFDVAKYFFKIYRGYGCISLSNSSLVMAPYKSLFLSNLWLWLWISFRFLFDIAEYSPPIYPVNVYSIHL